jgi:hypothetical protein
MSRGAELDPSAARVPADRAAAGAAASANAPYRRSRSRCLEDLVIIALLQIDAFNRFL